MDLGLYYATFIMVFIMIIVVAFVFSLLIIEELKHWRKNKKRNILTSNKSKCPK